jgi:hypothetical protein
MLSIRKLAIFGICLFGLHVCTLAFAQTTKSIPAGAKVFVAPMGGFETYLKSALQAKKVPLEVVEKREDAEFEISGTAESQKASTAKKVIMLDWHSKEEASIKVANLKTGEVVFAYSVVKSSSAHGKRSSAEACAKHLKEAIAAK